MLHVEGDGEAVPPQEYLVRFLHILSSMVCFLLPRALKLLKSLKLLKLLKSCL
jgi:hypothetical protein